MLHVSCLNKIDIHLAELETRLSRAPQITYRGAKKQGIPAL
jgi:hypothetical protein